MGCCRSTEHDNTVGFVQRLPVDFKELPEVHYYNSQTRTMYTVSATKQIQKEEVLGHELPRNPAQFDRGNSMWIVGGVDNEGNAVSSAYEIYYTNLSIVQRASLPWESSEGQLYKFKGRIYYISSGSRVFSYNARDHWFEQYFNPPAKLSGCSLFALDNWLYLFAGKKNDSEPNFDIYCYNTQTSEWKTLANKFKFNLFGPISCPFTKEEVLIFGGEKDLGKSRAMIKLPISGNVRIISSLPEHIDFGQGMNITLARKSYSHIVYVNFPQVLYFDGIELTWDSVSLS